MSPDSALTRTGNFRACPHLDLVPLMHLIDDLNKEKRRLQRIQASVDGVIPFCCKERLVSYKRFLLLWPCHQLIAASAIGVKVASQIRCSYPFFRTYVGRGVMVKHPDVKVRFLVATSPAPTRSNVPVLADRGDP